MKWSALVVVAACGGGGGHSIDASASDSGPVDARADAIDAPKAPPKWAHEGLVGYAASNNQEPTVAVAGNGDGMVAFMDDTSTVVSATHYRSSTHTFDPIIDLSTGAYPTLGADNAGNFLLLWLHNGQLFFSRYDAGSGWNVPAAVIASGVGIGFQLKMLKSGQAVLRYNTDQLIVYEPGIGWGTPQTFGGGNGDLDAIVIGDQVQIIEVWPVDPANVVYDLYGATATYSLTNHSLVVGSATLLETDDTHSYTSPAVRFDAAGNGLIACTDRTLDFTIRNILMGTYQGGSWSALTVLDPDTHVDYSLAMDVTPDGRAVVAWYTQHMNGLVFENGSFGATTSLGPTAFGQYAWPSIAFDSTAARAVAVWVQPLDRTVWSSVLDTTWSPGKAISVGGGVSTAVLGVGGNTLAIAAWETVNHEIYANVFR